MRHLSLILIGIFTTLLFVSILYLLFPKPLHDPDTSIVPPIPIEEEILKNMTPEEKVGQLFMFGINGTTISSETRKFLTEHFIGGVILYGKNTSSEKQIKLLTKELQTTNKIPLFVSIDQEGGIVSRIKGNKDMTIAQEDILDPEQAYTIAKNRGAMLKELGINMNLAPVVEYITNENSFMYHRVFRGTREEIAQKGIATVRGYTNSRIISVLKHYPGHGNTSPDSHYNLPKVNITEADWKKYIKPFSRILEQISVDGIMVGHIEYTKIDNTPATLSSKIISQKLIDDLQYKGLIISDDMEMKALTDIDSYTHLAKRALIAGNDILIYSTPNDSETSIQEQVYDYILQEVKAGNINIDNKVLEILRMKIKYNIIQYN